MPCWSIDLKFLFLSLFLVFLALGHSAKAQAPDNDIVGWPPGLVLFATTFYVVLTSSTEDLWNADPSIGLSLWNGLPWFSLKRAQDRNCSAPACHFVSKIRSAFGRSNFWINSKEISKPARREALQMALGTLYPVEYVNTPADVDTSMWSITQDGLLVSRDESIISSSETDLSSPPIKCPEELEDPSAMDFLLFAAVGYYMKQRMEHGYRIKIESKEAILFDTLGAGLSAVFDVHDEQGASKVVASFMGHPKERLDKPLSTTEDEKTYSFEEFLRSELVYDIRFPLGSASGTKVRATFDELAHAYLNVVQYIKRTVNTDRNPGQGAIARVDIDQCQWISVFGGVNLDTGRLTIRELPGVWSMKDVSADEAYTSRIEAVLDVIRPNVAKSSFSSIVSCDSSDGEFSYIFFLATLGGQGALSFFLHIGSLTGLWISVALTNIIFKKTFRDLHSLHHGHGGKGNELKSEPGLKIQFPGELEFMCVTTWNRTPPREKTLRPGFFLNLVGMGSAALAIIFENKIRATLGYSDEDNWKSYFSISSASLNTGVIVATPIFGILVCISVWRLWRSKRESLLRTSWILASIIPCILALPVIVLVPVPLFTVPIVECVGLLLCGVFFGMLENGRMATDVDRNVTHLILSVRWLVAALSSLAAWQ